MKVFPKLQSILHILSTRVKIIFPLSNRTKEVVSLKAGYSLLEDICQPNYPTSHRGKVIHVRVMLISHPVESTIVIGYQRWCEGECGPVHNVMGVTPHFFKRHALMRTCPVKGESSHLDLPPVPALKVSP